ncbi:MAG: hypothetical protein LQ340_005455 [Diploschistes diacapsis]|nr:MAG: hypothetical protein LQ340_005455 [Diploschistes diacapsis]
MAATHVNGLKRPYPDDTTDRSQKKPRSLNSPQAPQLNGAVTSKADLDKIVQEARAKISAKAAQLQGNKGTIPTIGATTSATNAFSPSASNPTVLDRIAQLRARVAAAKQNDSSLSPRTISPAVPEYQPQYEDGISRARGGLDVGLHPALVGDSSQDPKSIRSRQAMQPKFATTMANRRTESSLHARPTKPKKQLDLSGPSIEELKQNPYFDSSLGAKNAISKGRVPRQLVFNQKGKYVQQAAALRRQAALEAMKKRIAEQSKRAGMVDDIETEKVFLVPEPPEIEWWDESLVAGSNYTDTSLLDGLRIDTPDSVVTVYIQHPVAVEPPQEKITAAPKPMYLTEKEQKKKRRQRRMEELKEQQTKVRLGLEPAAPPKVKKSNLMRVLGEEAVKDPTAVEARVNREIADRYQKHMEQNEERKLTKEERHEKLAKQQADDAAKGIHCSVYRIESLANGRHRFKISKNAEQNALTGICIMHPRYCLVVVEGGQHSIKFYKKLMLNRIDWTESSGANSARESNQEALAAWLQAEDEKGNIKDLSSNACTLVWEGEQRARAFRKWGSKVCETDKDAKDALHRAKMDSFWTLAKSKAPGQS